MASAFFCCAAARARHRGAAVAVRLSALTPFIARTCPHAVAASATLPLASSLFPRGRLLHARAPSPSRLLAAAAAEAAGAGAAAAPRGAAAGLAASPAECSAVVGAAGGTGRSTKRVKEGLLPCGRQESRRCFSSGATTGGGAAVAWPQQTSEKKEEGGCPTLEGRYAVALLRAAKQQNQLQAVYEEMMNMKELLQQSEDFRRFIETPALSTSQKEALLQQLGTTYKLQQITVNLLQVLLENKRVPLLGRVADAFEILYRKEKGEVRCLVTSAHPVYESEGADATASAELLLCCMAIDDAAAAASSSPAVVLLQPLNSQQQKEVVAALQKRAGPRAKLILDYVVNPHLMGGLVVRLGEQVLDFSVATSIDRLQAQLMAPL